MLQWSINCHQMFHHTQCVRLLRQLILKLLTKIRYSSFIVLYPLGVFECLQPVVESLHCFFICSGNLPSTQYWWGSALCILWLQAVWANSGPCIMLSVLGCSVIYWLVYLQTNPGMLAVWQLRCPLTWIWLRFNIFNTSYPVSLQCGFTV